MATRQEKVNAGLFLLTGVLLLFGTSAVILGLRLRHDTKEYQIEFTESVAGLNKGSSVVYLGVPVGTVRSITPHVGAVMVGVEVRRDTPIKSGTYATLDTNLLTRLTSIELRGGDRAEEDLAEGSVIPWQETALGKLPGAFGDVEVLLERFNDLLKQENREAVEKTLSELADLVVEAREGLAFLRTEVAGLSRNLGRVGQSLEQEGGGLRSDVARGVDSFVLAADGVSQAAREFRELTLQMRDVVAGLSELQPALEETLARAGSTLEGSERLVHENRRSLAHAMAGLERSARTLSALLAEVGHQPAALLRAEPRPEHRRGE